MGNFIGLYAENEMKLGHSESVAKTRISYCCICIFWFILDLI